MVMVLQWAVILAWHAVPQLSVVPAWVIFAPFVLVAVTFLFVFLLIGVGGIIERATK